jgi:hypothetical protein
MITELAMVIGGFTPCSKRMGSQSLKNSASTDAGRRAVSENQIETKIQFL